MMLYYEVPTICFIIVLCYIHSGLYIWYLKHLICLYSFLFSLLFGLCTWYFIPLQGDVLFLRMSNDPIRAGEIVVFNVDVSSSFH